MRACSVAGLIVVLVVAGRPGPVAAQDQAAVVQVVEEFFEGMRAKDSLVMQRTLAPMARLIAVTPAGEARSIPMADFIRNVVGRPQVLDERVFDPEVRISDRLASVWVAYDLTIDGAFSHCGFDAFQLSRLSDGWRITQIADSRQTTGCTTPRAPR